MEIKRFLFSIASGILVFLTGLFIFSFLFLLLKLEFTGLIFVISLIVTLCYEIILVCSLVEKHLRIKGLIFALGTTLLLLGVSIFIASKTYDVSFDGTDYQQRAVTNIVEGWNPIYENIDVGEDRSNTFLNSYPKASWLVYASTYSLFNNIETAKFVNVLIIPTTFIFMLYFLLSFKKITLLPKILIATLFALNPVFIYQACTTYIDSQVGFFVLLWLIVLVLPFIEKDQRILKFIPFLQGLILIYSINIKFTGSAYIFVITGIYAIILFVKYLKKKNFKNIVKPLLPILIGGFFGVFIFGFNPYVSNTLKYNNPVYPVYGSSDFSAAYLMGNQMPDNFVGDSSVVKLFKSVFSTTGNIFKGSVSVYKYPFVVSENEFLEMVSPDIRIGGLGPLFAMIIILSFVLVMCHFIFANYERKRKKIFILYLLVITILATILINPESWWARYAPQLWFIPLVIILLSYFSKKQKLQSVIRAILLFVAFFNVIGILKVNIEAANSNRVFINSSLSKFKEAESKIYVFPGIFESGLLKFKKYGIDYVEVESIDNLCEPNAFLGMQVSTKLCN